MIRDLNSLRRLGRRQFQLKVGADWKADIDRLHAVAPLIGRGEKALADANQGWRVDDAIHVVRATRDLDDITEQPCRTYEECLAARRI